jgi:hypothetical protein
VEYENLKLLLQDNTMLQNQAVEDNVLEVVTGRGNHAQSRNRVIGVDCLSLPAYIDVVAVACLVHIVDPLLSAPLQLECTFNTPIGTFDHKVQETIRRM